MRKIFVTILLLITLVIRLSAQSCYTCPSCNQAAYIFICQDNYDYGMNQNTESLFVDLDMCNIDATLCLQNEGYNPTNIGDAPVLVIDTPCEEPYNDCKDTAYESFVNYTDDISEAFHECAGAAGCGDTW